jgi:hypothetical protein
MFIYLRGVVYWYKIVWLPGRGRKTRSRPSHSLGGTLDKDRLVELTWVTRHTGGAHDIIEYLHVHVLLYSCYCLYIQGRTA